MASFYDRVVSAYPSTSQMGGGQKYSYVRSGQNNINGDLGQQVLPPSVLESLPVQLVNKMVQGPGRGAGLVPGGVDESKLPSGTTSIMGQAPGRGGGQIVTGYQVPIDVPGMQEKDARGNAMPKFVAEYDNMGNFKQITTKDKYYVTSGKGRDDVYAKPIIDPSGRLVDSQASTQAMDDKQGSNFLGALASFVLPAIFPGVGSAISNQLMSAGISSPAIANAIGQGLFSSGATALGGGSTQDIIKAGLTSGLLSGATSTLSGTTPSVTTAPTSTASSGTGLSLGGGNLGLSATKSGLGITAASPGASAIGGSIGSQLAGITTGIGASSLLGGASTNDVIPPYQAQPVTPPTTPPAPIELPPPPPAPVTPPPAPPTDAFAGLSGADIALGMSGAGAAPGVAASTLPITASNIGAGMSVMDKLSEYGSGILDFAKANPSLAGSLLGALTGSISAAKAPTSQTTTTSIDPQIKAEYLANLERAKTAAAELGAKQYVEPGEKYKEAETALYNLGMTPFGAKDIQQFYNPYEEQVVQGALGDIERTRQMQALQDAQRATAARAFGGSRYGVQSALTNEAALRQAATTSGQLRQAGFTQAANLGLAARPLNISGLQTSLGLGAQRDALAQARLDAARNLPLERLAITGGALGLQPANVGQTATQPLYSSPLGSALSGGLTGAYIGSLLQPKQQVATG